MKKNSPTYQSVAMCLIGAASTMVSVQAGAFQLGQIQSTSRLGEPLTAQINVMMSPRETLLGTKLDVLPDFDYRNDPVMKDALRSITAKLVRNQYGQHYIALSSTQELNVPVLAFRLKAANGDNILIQRYSLTPPPPLRPRAQSANRLAGNAVGRRRMASTNQPIAAALDTGPTISGNTYGPVKAGDTLWKIASKVAGKDRAGAVVNQLFELNPHAFINGDINKLKQGVTLTLPGVESAPDIATVSTLNTPTEIDKVVAPSTLDQAIEKPAEIQTFDSPPTSGSEITADEFDAGAFEAAVASIDTDLEPSTVVDATNSAVDVAGKSVDWRAENPELANKLEQLSDKYAALRARYAGQSENGANLDTPRASAVDATTAFEETLTANLIDEAALDPNRVSVSIEKTRSTDAVIEPQPIDDNVVAAEAEFAQLAMPDQEPTATNTSRFELPSWALMLIGLGLLLSAVGYFIYRARAAARLKAEQLLRKEKDNSLKQELAKKAQHRISMEDEVERMLHEQVVEEDGDEIEKTMQLHVDELMTQQNNEAEIATEISEQDSTESRIDASISHGRYAEAEDLLREVIGNYPRNFNAKLRLAEVYYITEKISDFVSVSQDIHAHHRPDISDEDWRRVMRMGKMIAPEQAPFSGPQSIMDDVSAG